MSITIAQLAQEFGIQQHELEASLGFAADLDITGETLIDDIDGWTEDEARQVLTLMAEQADNA